LPIKTDVTYFGTKGEDVGWRYTAGSLFLSLLAGQGFRWWLRDIHDTTATDTGGNTVQVSGYQKTGSAHTPGSV
jgi:hypothetical protein